MSMFQNVKVKAGFVAGAVSLLLPAVALAQSNDLTGVLDTAQGIINQITPFLVGLAVFIVIWGVFKFISSAGDDEKRGEAQKFVLWGVVGIFIMVSVWGLVNILLNTAPTPNTPVIVPPVFQP